MKEFSIVVFICFMVWQLNNIYQLEYARNDLKGCVQLALDNYTTNWNNSCHSDHKKDNCSLNALSANMLDEDFKVKADRCVKIFESNK